ncbi:MAG TPA: F0F1 ATP synthase subunit B [Saprospiraceae bacterium]|nr:F0F1 ATP synthase subunit B [Saprospiraceae bacterium]
MISLLNFNPFIPSPGLVFWTVIIFVLFWWIMGKFAFTPIAKALEKREGDIQDALDQAKKAKEEMANMKYENEKLLAEAREERSKILQEAKDIKNQIVNEAKDKAKEEASRIVASAKTEIDNQKKAALVEVKNQVGNMALEIAEKVIKKQLAGNQEQESLVKSMVDDMNLN